MVIERDCLPSQSRHFVFGAGLTIEETVLEALEPGSWALTGAVVLEVHMLSLGWVGVGVDLIERLKCGD